MHKRLKATISLLICILMVLPIFTAVNAQQTATSNTPKESIRYIYQSTDYLFEVIDNKKVTILFYIGTDTDVVTPSRLGGYPVTKVDKWAFFNTNVTKVRLSEGITHIGDEAFAECKNLTAVTLPATLIEAGKSVFKNASKLKTVSFRFSNHPVTIGDYFLYNCQSLTSITMPDGLTEIPDKMLTNCSSLRSVTLPENIKSIGDYAFHGCKLYSVTLPESLNYIGDYAFAYNTSLYTIYAKNKNCYAEDTAFYKCPAKNPFEEEIITTTQKDDPVIITTTVENPTMPEPSSTVTTPELSEPTSETVTDPQHTVVQPTVNPPYEPDMITIYFTNNKNWDNVFIYGFYGVIGEEPTIPSLGDYPGTKMTFVEKNGFGQDVYSAVVPEDIDYIKFSDGDVMGINNRTDNIPNHEFGHNTGFYLSEKGNKFWGYNTYYYSSSTPEESTSTDNISPNPSDTTTQATSDEPSSSTETEIPPNPSNPTDPEVSGLIGDANNDSCINILDALAIQKVTAGMAETDTINADLADTDRNDYVNVKDSTEILKYLTKLPNKNFVGKLLSDGELLPGNQPEEPYKPVQKDGEGLNIGGITYNVSVGDVIDYTVSLSCAELITALQAKVLYDSDKLQLVRHPSDDPDYEDWEIEASIFCPWLDSLVNADLENEIRFNTVKLSGYNFKERKVLINLQFVVLDTSYSEILIEIEHIINEHGEPINDEAISGLESPTVTTPCPTTTENVTPTYPEPWNPTTAESTTLPFSEPHGPDSPGSSPENFVVDLKNYYSSMAAPDMPGDANCDNRVNVRDATRIQKAVAGIEVLSFMEHKNSDVDQDGAISVKDATIVQKFVSGVKTGSIMDDYFNKR